MLDIDHGTYPFVTSSSAAAGGACTGTAFADENRRNRRCVEGLYHACRRGPFPSEDRGEARGADSQGGK